MTLLLIFVAPPVSAYLVSLYFLRLADFEIMFISLGGVVFLFAMAACFVELHPWHLFKVFTTEDPKTR